MSALASSSPLSGVLLGWFVVIAALFVTRVVRHLRRHRRLANRRFMRRYRASRPPVRRTRPASLTRGASTAPAVSPPHRRTA